MSNNRSEIQYVHGEKMKKLHSSNRGLTFSITPNEQYYPGGHYIYEVRPTCIIIRPSKSGLKISKKRSGANINALFDLRSKKVRDAVFQMQSYGNGGSAGQNYRTLHPQY